MLKQNWNWLLVFVIAIAPYIPLNARAQEPTPSDSPPQTPTSQPTTPLEELVETFQQRRPRNEGIRRGAICAIAPATERLQMEDAVIWSDRPLFLWQTDPNLIQVRSILLYNPQTDEIIWEQALTPTDQSKPYSGTPLEPGKVYGWELRFQRQNPQTQTWERETLSSIFQVLPGDRRNSIMAELQRLQTASPNPQAAAIQQAQYLADQNLWSDALQILKTVENPTPELTQTLEEMINNVCNTQIDP